MDGGKCIAILYMYKIDGDAMKTHMMITKEWFILLKQIYFKLNYNITLTYLQVYTAFTSC